jgi:hypothetical protein
VTDEVERPKWRANYVPAPHYFNLNHACLIINRAFDGFGCYLVGSATRTRDYRDVDIRYIMADDAFDRMFRKSGNTYHFDPLWSLMCASFSLWLSQQSGLPIDFQIQRQTQANEEHSVKDGHERQAIGLLFDAPPTTTENVGATE